MSETVREMTREELVAFGNELRAENEKLETELKEARLAVEMSEDLISRQAAIDAIKASTSKYTGFMEMEMYTDDDAVEAIKALPPARPEGKNGKWLPNKRYDDGYWVCSSCKNPTEAFAANVLYKYCPFCGADMRGEQNGKVR